jgi:hypothetical protein
MHKHSRIPSGVIRSAGLLLVLYAGFAVAQSQPSAPAQKPVVSTSAATERDLVETREQLLKLLRMSPTLTTVVARDPSLLSNQEYVIRNTPELARFLQSHPEVASNPDFYLFANLSVDDGPPEDALERKMWPQLTSPRHDNPMMDFLRDDVGPVLFFSSILGALLWLIHVLLENRRWGRIFKLQTEVHGKLIDRFGTSQELLTYMGTEAGKRFLEAAPIPVDLEHGQRMPNAVARVLTPLQIGIVLTLLGTGFLFLRHSLSGIEAPFLVLGVTALMTGVGFIISAGITWVMAERLGLMPDRTGAQSQLDPLHDSKERL